MRVAKVNFNDCIGGDFFFGGITESFVRYCIEGPNSFDPAIEPVYPESVELHFFNCPGGEVYEGYGIYTYLRQLAKDGVKISAYIHGLCASIASLVVLAADVRYIGELGTPMIHKPLVDAGPWANADDHTKAAAELDQIEGQLAAIYASRTNIPAAELPALMRAETSFTAAEALANGFATASMEDIPAPNAEKAKKVLNYAKPPTPAAMATLTEKEEKGLFAKFQAWLTDKGSAAKAAAKPKANTPPPGAAAAAEPAPVAAATGTEFPLADGTSVFVDTSDDGIADIDEGDAVFTDEALTTPVADGDYSLEDGRDFTVAGGMVTQIDADPNAAVEPAAPAQASAKKAPAKPQPSSPAAKLKAAEARATRAEAALKAHVPGSGGDPNKPGNQVFASDDGGSGAHPLDKDAATLKAMLKRRF